MRSTRVRTLDETVVTIPNGSFSSMEIENYARRKRFLFRHTMRLRYETSPDAVERACDAIRTILNDTDAVIGDTTRVRFVALGTATLNVEIFAYVAAAELNDFLEVQEALLLAVMRRFETFGIRFAFPSQTVYLERGA
jgi:MscS family membrane protein